MTSKVACVTGANRGIGFEIAKKLLLKEFIVIMACRNQSTSQKAEADLKKAVKGANIEHVKIDLGFPDTAKTAALEIKRKFPEGIDLLINNAGFAYTVDAKEPFHQQAIDSIKFNYYGTVAVCEALLPLIKKEGRIINVSSTSGSLSKLSNKELIKKWKKCDSKDSIEQLLHEFIKLTKIKGKHLSTGWPDSAYGVSKLALTTYTRILGTSTPNIHIFSCCPGYCKTEMSSFQGYKTAEEGADTPVWLSTSEEVLQLVPQGGFVTERAYMEE